MNPMILEILKRAEIEKKKLVKFSPRQTECPVCRFFGFESKGSVRILKTNSDGVRYCECSKCGSHFRAVEEKTEIEKVQLSCTSEKKGYKIKNEKKIKGAGKNVGTLGLDSRTNRSQSRYNCNS